VRSLLKEGENPNSIDPPVFWALLNDNFTVADLLVRFGARVDVRGVDDKVLRSHFADYGPPCKEIVAWIDSKQRK
jgi:hypothetical protein